MISHSAPAHRGGHVHYLHLHLQYEQAQAVAPEPKQSWTAGGATTSTRSNVTRCFCFP